MLYSTSRVYTQSSLILVFFHTMNLRRCTLPLAGLQFTTGEAACWHWHTAMLTSNKNVLDRTQWVNNGLVKRSSNWYSAPSRHGHHRGTQVHGAHQAASHVPALYLPSYSRYSFTDPERMEGWVSPGPGCKEQLAHGCYTTARSQRTRTHDFAAAGRAR